MSDKLAQALRNMIDWLDDGNRMLSDSCAADVAAALAALAEHEDAQKAEPAPELTDEQLNAVVSSINRELTGFRGWSLLQVMRAAIAADRKNRGEA
jgi:hypothetical protein